MQTTRPRPHPGGGEGKERQLGHLVADHGPRPAGGTLTQGYGDLSLVRGNILASAAQACVPAPQCCGARAACSSRSAHQPSGGPTACRSQR